MNKITFPRVGYEGIERTQKDIEKWYVDTIAEKICESMQNVNLDVKVDKYNKKHEKDIEALLKELKKLESVKAILLYTPAEIYTNKERFEVVKNIKTKKRTRKKKTPNTVTRAKKSKTQKLNLREKILKAFNYEGFRKKELVELAKRLNVKVCPYCNMHYTLYAEKEYSKGKDEVAKFQFDHFVNKNDYPMFSMSLYNLIPSCTVCNQGKYKKELPLALNPYYIKSRNLFHFEVKKPLPLLMGKKEKDAIKIDVVCNNIKNSTDVETYDDAFHISTLYSRHKDVVQEIFDKTYIASSARDIAKMLMRNKKNSSKEERLIEDAIDKIEGYGGRYLSELWYGTYLSEKDIEKRPLTKFIQDIKKQSESIF